MARTTGGGLRKAPEKTPTPSLQRIGTTGTDIISGFITEERLPEFTTPYQRAIILDQMRRNDSTIAVLLRGLELPLKRANFGVEPASEEPEDVEAAEFLRHALFDAMSKPWLRTLSEMLSLFQYGNSTFEEVHKVEDWFYTPPAEKGDAAPPKEQLRKGMVMWDRFAFCHAKTIRRWFISTQDQVLGVEQMGYYQDGAETWYESAVELAGDNLLLFALDQLGNNYEGVSIIRSAWRDYKALENLQKIQLRGCQRMALGVPVINEPELTTVEDRTAAQQVVRGYGAGEEPGMVMPYGWKTEVQEGRMNEHALLNAINFHRTQILQLGLLQFLVHGTGGQSGNRAMSGVQIDLFIQLLQSTGDYIAEVVTSKSKRVLKWNYPNLKRYPRVKLLNLVDKDVKAAVDSINACLQARSLQPAEDIEDHVRALNDLPPRPDDVPYTPAAGAAAAPGAPGSAGKGAVPKDPQAIAQAQKDEETAGTLRAAEDVVALSASRLHHAVKRHGAAHWEAVAKDLDGQEEAFQKAASGLLIRQQEAVQPYLQRAADSGDLRSLGHVKLPMQDEYRALLTDQLITSATMGLRHVVQELGEAPAGDADVRSWAETIGALMTEKHEADFRMAVVGQVASAVTERRLRPNTISMLSDHFAEAALTSDYGRLLAAVRDVVTPSSQGVTLSGGGTGAIELRESDDHYYGAWSGGPAAEGGHPKGGHPNAQAMEKARAGRLASGQARPGDIDIHGKMAAPRRDRPEYRGSYSEWRDKHPEALDEALDEDEEVEP